MRYRLLITILLTTRASWGQLQMQSDTLTYFDRIGGRLDSVDIANSKYASIFDGGREIRSTNALHANTLLSDLHRHVFQPQNERDVLKFSALPHLGFAYSFGGQGSQYLRTEYQQAFSPRLLLNINYQRNSAAGYLRESQYSDNEVSLQLARQGTIYSFLLHGYFFGSDTEHPGGVVTDTLIEAFGLEYTPVYKQSSESKNKSGQVSWTNYFDLLKDSLNQLGIMSTHAYDILNREYRELDTLYGIYNEVNIDSVSTRDQYNLAAIENGVGFFWSKANRIYVDLSGAQRYWRFQNLGVNRDTMEYYLNSKQIISFGRLTLNNDLRANLSGAYNGVNDRLKAKYRSKRIMGELDLTYSNLAPEVMDRRLYANNYSYDLLPVEKNEYMATNLKSVFILIDSLLRGGLTLSYNNVSSLYYFDGYNWRNDTLQSYSFGSVGLNLAFTWRSFNFRANAQYSFDPEGYLPQTQEYTRIYLKGRLFKAKKLEAMVGVEQDYISAYRRRVYTTNADLFNWLATSGEVPAMVNLHAFLNFGIDEFRFYFRFENIGYFWNDRTIQLIEGYPLTGTRLRVGLTWDFFN